MWSSKCRLTGSRDAAQPLGLVGLMVQLHIWAHWAMWCSSSSEFSKAQLPKYASVLHKYLAYVQSREQRARAVLPSCEQIYLCKKFKVEVYFL